MLAKKLLRTALSYKAQFISMILMVTLGVGMFIGFNMEWASIEHNMSSYFEDCNFADYRLIDEKGYTNNDLDKITLIDGVDEASRYISTNVDITGTDSDSVCLMVTTNRKVSSFILMSGEEYDPNSTDGVWISDKYADNNNLSLGDEISFSFNSINLTGKIKGFIKSAEQMICVRDNTQLMPDYQTHGFAYISPVLYENTLGYDYYPQINIISTLTKSDLSEKVNDALNSTVVILTKDDTISYSQAEGEVDEGKSMGSILPALFLLIGLLTMITTMHRITTKEKTQIGILKALGFRDSKIIMHYTSYAFFVSILGSILGTGLGYGIAYLIMNPNGMMGTYLDMPSWDLVLPWFCILILIATICLLTFTGFISIKKMLAGNTADALRPYTPKNIKSNRLLRTSFFKKRSFSFKWNMRNVFRQKTRSITSLIGVIGCTVLILAAFGMKDTMNAFLDNYYNNGLNYSSRIILSETATVDDAYEIKNLYNGDSSSSLSVQLEDKTISLDIFNITHDKIRFIDEDSNNLPLTDDGAYVCLRLAEEFGLKEGDIITLCPFGSNETYKLKIAGTFRSISESIIISDDYANDCSIRFNIDSVYTDSSKDDISLSNAISAVQSKQKIIDSFETFYSIMNIMVYMFVVGAVTLGVIVLYNLGTMNYLESYRELATLKVLGFRDIKISKLLIGQNIALSITGIIIGLPAGALALNYMLKALASEYEMKMEISIFSYVITIMITILMSLIVSLFVSRKNKNINMVEALKDKE